MIRRRTEVEAQPKEAIRGGSGRAVQREYIRPAMRVGQTVEDMIDVRDFTRAGALSAMACTIIPPMDAPQMWAASISSASSSPKASLAMSSSV